MDIAIAAVLGVLLTGFILGTVGVVILMLWGGR